MAPCWQQFVVQQSYLVDEEYQIYIVEQMTGENPEPIHENYERDYVMHMPLDIGEYFKDLLDTISNCEHNEDCFNVDDSIRTYIASNIYHIITQARYSLTCKLKAATIFFELMKVSDKFMLMPLYDCCVCLFYDIYKRRGQTNLPLVEIKNCISSIISYIKPMDSDNPMFPYLIKMLVQMCMFHTTEIMAHNFSQDASSDSIDVLILNHIKDLIFYREKRYNTGLIYEHLFVSYSKMPTILMIENETVNYAQSNMLSYIRYLFQNLDEIEKNKFVIASISYICGPEFNAYRKFVSILLVFDEERVKFFLKKLSAMLISKNHVSCVPQILKLVVALVHSFNAERVHQKYHVHLQTCVVNLIKLLRHVTLANTALVHLTILCMAPNRLFNHFISTLPTSFTYNRNLLLGIINALTKLVEPHNAQRNHMIFNVFFYFLLQRDSEIEENCCVRFLTKLTNSCNAYGLRSMISKFHEYVYTFMGRRRTRITHCVINILLNSALSNDASSKDYLKHFYKCLTQPSTVQDTEYPIGVYAVHLLENKPNFIQLMTTFRTHKLIKEYDVNRLFEVVTYTNIKELTVLGYFIEYSPNPVSHMLNLLNYILAIPEQRLFLKNYSSLFHALNLLVEKSNGNFTISMSQKLDVLYCLLSEHLQNQSVHLSAFQIVYKLWLNLANAIKVDYEKTLQNLKTMYYVNLEKAYTTPLESHLPISYAREFFLASGMNPQPRLISEIFKKLTNEIPADPQQHTKWMPLLIFFTNCAFKITSIENKAITCCKIAILRSDKSFIKHLAMLTYYNFIDEVTKDYTDIINILFKEIESIPDVSLLKLYLQLIDKLIEKEYLKLTGLQFFKFVAPLTSNVYYMKTRDILYRNLVANHNLVARYFIPTMFYVNNFKSHPFHRIENNFKLFLPYGPESLVDTYSMYQFLFKTLPIKKQFQILNELGDILGDLFEDKYDLKSSQKLISDIITVFEVTVTTGLEPLTVNRDLVKLIWHDLIQKGQPSSNLTKIKGEEFPEYFDEIKNLTVVLLKMYHCEYVKESVQKKIFMTILHWTKYFIKDLTTMIYYEKNEQLFDLYKKINTSDYELEEN